MITCPVCKSYMDLELPQREDAQSERTELGPSDAAACSPSFETVTVDCGFLPMFGHTSGKIVLVRAADAIELQLAFDASQAALAAEIEEVERLRNAIRNLYGAANLPENGRRNADVLARGGSTSTCGEVIVVKNLAPS